VDVRWTRIEEVVIMEWLSGETSPEAAIIFNASSLPNPARDAPASGVVTIPATDLKSPTGNEFALPALVDVGSIS
jgi:hypothetical protein